METCLVKFRAGALWTALLACSLTASAVPVVSGSASLWGYARDDSIEHVQLVPALSLTLSELGKPDLRFEGSLRGYADVRRDRSEDRALRLLRGVFIYAPDKSRWEVRLGEQWLTEGVGRGNVAGGWLRFRPESQTAITVYGGARVANSLSLEKKNGNEGVAGGFNVRTRIHPLTVGASYTYASKGGDLLYHAAGVEASGRIVRTLQARGRFEMNVAQGSVERAQLLLQWTARKDVLVTGEFRSQTPRIYEDSFFTTFLSKASTDFGRAAVRWSFYKMFYAKGGATIIFSENPDPLYKAYAALGCRYAELGYTHWASVSKSTQDGLYAQGNYRVAERADLFAGYDFAKGSNADRDLRADTESQSAYLGGSVTPLPYLTATVRAERISDLQRSEDWRALGGLTVRFATR